MTFGRKVPNGHLPVFSVGTEQEAQELIVLSCETNIRGEYIARELTVDQTLDNLEKFGDRLEQMHEILKKNGRCTCK